MEAEGLDAGNYAFFMSNTWWETQTEVAAVEADEENGIEAKDAYTRTDTYDTKDEAPEGDDMAAPAGEGTPPETVTVLAKAAAKLTVVSPAFKELTAMLIFSIAVVLMAASVKAPSAGELN